MFRLYALARFAHKGKKRRPRFNRTARIVRIYQRRRTANGRKLVRVTHCMYNSRRAILRIKRRVAPACLLKIARSGKLEATPRRHLLQR